MQAVCTRRLIRMRRNRPSSALFGNLRMTSKLLFLVATLTVQAAPDNAARPRLAADIDMSVCLDPVAQGAIPDPQRCPGFLIQPITDALQSCREAGGKLRAASPANVWAIDVNGDGKREYVFEYAGNVDCEGLPSLFDCGSLGCPKELYEEHAGAWRPIGEIYADSMESVEALAPATGQRYRTLRVGCAGETPCPEYWISEWTGEHYERERIEVRGFVVEFANSIHGLHNLVGETDVLATPESGATVIGHYDASTEVAIVGTAKDADYYYVSPCNACDSGFVPTSAVRVP